MLSRTLVFTLALLGSNAASAGADPAPAFVGPPGWSHAAVTADPNRTVEQWHIAGDVTSLTYIKDTATTYDDAIAAIEKNFSTNNIKPSTDHDLPCRGKTGHQVEFSIGPGGHQIAINRIVVPDGTGVDTLTYARSSDVPFDAGVKKSETAFCSATGS